MFSERTWRLVIIWNDPNKGNAPPPPHASNISRERMINNLPLLVIFPPFPNQITFTAAQTHLYASQHVSNLGAMTTGTFLITCKDICEDVLAFDR